MKNIDEREGHIKCKVQKHNELNSFIDIVKNFITRKVKLSKYKKEEKQELGSLKWKFLNRYCYVDYINRTILYKTFA